MSAVVVRGIAKRLSFSYHIPVTISVALDKENR